MNRRFQEQQLARRALFLINDQADFMCHTRVFAEDIVCENAPCQSRLEYTAHQQLFTLNKNVINQYFGAVENYSGRQLTYAGGVIDAFLVLCPSNAITLMHSHSLDSQIQFSIWQFYGNLLLL
jgi:hypothetical protein